MITKSALEKLLKSKIVEIKFNKKDGNLRTMLCSLKQEFLPKADPSKTKTAKKTPNPDVLAVWDLEREAYRSFRLNSVIDYQAVEEGYEL